MTARSVFLNQQHRIMTKVYGIYGRTTAELSIPVGKATLPLVFERGCLDRKNFRPAVFMTSKPAIQDMIENSPLFGKTIVLVKTYGANVEAAPKKEEKRSIIRRPATRTKEVVDQPSGEEGAPEHGASYPDIDTKAAAAAVLKSLGAKADDLEDDEAMKAFMEKVNVSFPNLSL